MALQKLNAQTLEGDLDVVDITASGDITLTSTASFKIPSGTTAQRGTSTTGALRFNSTTSGFEGYDGTEWGTIGGGGLTDADEDTYITAEATADSDDLDFWTAGTKRMTIDQAGAVTITGDLTVSGTTTTIDSTTINVQTAFVFEGATADDYETTLAVIDPTADRTITLPDADGTLVHVSSPTASIKMPVGTTAQRGTATQGAFRYNTTTPGFEGYDGSAWGAISGAENAYTKETFTATANQTTFTLTNAYTLGYIEVYLNGVKLISGDDFTATSSSAPYTVVLSSGVTAGNVVQTVAFNTFVVAEDTMITETFTATANQTTFTLATAYTAGFINVYLNGIKLVVGTDVTASNGTTVVLIAGADVGDTLQTEAFGTFSVANTVPATGGTFSGTVTLSGGVNIAGTLLSVGTFTSRGIHDVAPSNALTIDANKNVGIGTGNPVSALTIAGATSNLSTFTEDLTVAANYSMAVIGPVTIPNVTVNGNLNIMTELNVTGDIDTGANGSFNIIG